MKQIKRKTKAEYLQDIVKDYIASGEPWPTDRRTIATWAIRHRRYEPSPKSLIDRCAKEFADAMRLEMEKDPQGRLVRAKHCAKITESDDSGELVQKVLWFDRSAPPDLMRISFQQRRRAILSDNRQLKLDADSYNENNAFGACIQLSFNYEADLLDAEQPTEYNPKLDGDADTDDGF